MKQLPFYLTMVILFVAAAHEMGTYTSAAPIVINPQTRLEKNKETALKIFHAVSKGNMDQLGSIFKVPAGDDMASSKESLKEKMQRLLIMTNDYKAENIKIVADGDYVFILADWTGSFKKDLMGSNASVNTFIIPDVDIFKFNEEGKIVEHRGIQSVENILEQISRYKN